MYYAGIATLFLMFLVFFNSHFQSSDNYTAVPFLWFDLSILPCTEAKADLQQPTIFYYPQFTSVSGMKTSDDSKSKNKR